MKNNILITSAGKRVELLKEFKNELNSLLHDGKIFAVDLNPFMSPACHIADASFKVPRVTSEDYIACLLNFCINNNIKLIIPTIDTELKILAENLHLFAENKIDVMISDKDFISICRDKRLTIELFNKLGIKTPALVDKFNPVFPIFAKPYDGSLSSNLHIIRSKEDLTKDLLADPKLIFMEYVDKSEYKEYTVDMYFDSKGVVKSIVPRERMEIRAGEINKGATRKNFIVKFLLEKMGVMRGVRGAICVQIFYREFDNDILGIEINPRFGGGYPLSYYAGANFPKMMIEEYILKKEMVYSENWKNNTLLLRYDSQVIIYE